MAPAPKSRSSWEEAKDLARIFLYLMALYAAFVPLGINIYRSSSRSPVPSKPTPITYEAWLQSNPACSIFPSDPEDFEHSLNCTNTELYALQISASEAPAALEELPATLTTIIRAQEFDLLSSIMLWYQGLDRLNGASGRVSKEWWFGAASLGLIGANLGVALAIWKLDELTWDIFVLCKLGMVDLHMIHGLVCMMRKFWLAELGCSANRQGLSQQSE